MTAIPTLADTLAARKIVTRHHPRTGLYRSAPLSRRFDCDFYVKYENHAPIRSFKARGALYRLSQLPPDEAARGVVTASTGNHGQGIAFAGGRLGISSVVVIPEGTPRVKVEAMRDLGADLRVIGADLTASHEAALAIAAQERRLYIEDGEDPGLLAGAASLTWEILEDLPDVDVILVPVGGGNLIASVALVAHAVNPRVQIVGVQSDAAAAVYLSWQARTVTYAPCATFAGGLATDHPGRLAFGVFQDHVDSVVLVSEDELRHGIALLLATTGNVAEGAGAAAVAAAERYGRRWRRRRVAAILSGGNIDPLDLTKVVNQYHDSLNQREPTP